jgi:glycosyltransferase involved in cell wall biosynthesis
MRASVVIPCFNDQQFLPEAIASVRSQEPSELVVVDDGSTDPAMLRLLDSLAAEGVKVLHQANSGPSAARMAGVAASHAPYVLPLDADDLLAPGSLAALADALDADPGVGVAWGDLELFRPSGARLEGRGPRSLDAWLITYVNELPLSALFRREVLTGAGGYQLREGYEDWDLWMALAERGVRGVHVPRVVERHREHGGRRWSQDFSRHERALTTLRERHAGLFAARAASRSRSGAPSRQKLLLPLIEASSFISATTKYRLAHVVSHPLRFSQLQLQRLGVVRSSRRPRTTRTAS